MNFSFYAYTALGGALGAMGRFCLSTWIHGRGDYIFPWGTFAVNILGCFALGFIYIIGIDKMVLSPNARAFTAIGFLGSFTTFSTFSLETLNILKDGEIKIALLNILGSIIVGIFAVWTGILAGQLISK